MGEKYFQYFGQGGNDLDNPTIGARAILQGKNPYEGWWRGALAAPALEIEGYRAVQLYPPLQLLFFIPFVLVTGENTSALHDLFFFINILCLVGLACCAQYLWVRATTDGPIHPDPRKTFAWGPFVLFLLPLLHGGASAMALERGQTDCLTAFLTWAAVAAAAGERRKLAWGIALAATFFKAYPLLVLLGFTFLFFDFILALRMLAGALALGLVSVCVMPGSLWAVWYRFARQLEIPASIAFRELFQRIDSRFATQAVLAAAVLGGLATILAAVRASHAESRSQRIRWLCLFATCAMSLPVELSVYSYPYAVLLFLPGLLVLVASLSQTLASVDSPVWRWSFGISFIAAAAGIASIYWFASPNFEKPFPILPVGVLLFFFTTASLAFYEIKQLRSAVTDGRKRLAPANARSALARAR